MMRSRAASRGWGGSGDITTPPASQAEILAQIQVLMTQLQDQ